MTDLSMPDSAAPDGKPASDGGGSASCPAGAHGFVFNRVIIPTDSTASEKYALVFKGKKYNSLGGILALISSQAPSLSVQILLDEAICAGSSLHLLCLQAKSLVNDPAAKGMTWPGTASCCSTSPCFNSSTSQCGSAAKSACFSGTSALKPLKGYTSTTVPGKVTAAAISLGPGKMVLYIPMPGGTGTAKPILVPLKGAMITGNLTTSGIYNGVLAGGVDKVDLDKKVVPGLAAGINAAYTDPGTTYQTKTLLKTLFDANKDGQITAAELKSNALIKVFLDGDVDVDGDGTKELSMGVGFTAVGAKITTP